MARKKNYRELLTTPIETSIRNFPHIANYFLYYAPNIDSPQSQGKIEGNAAKSVFNDMIKQAGLANKYKIVEKVQPGVWKSNQLDDDMLDFEIARFTYDKICHETELQAVLRHLRNALAHGHIYVWKKRTKEIMYFL